MVNPYREHADKLIKAVKDTSKEFLYSTPFEGRFTGSDIYASNFVVVSGGEPFDTRLEEVVRETMKEATGDSDPETM